MTRAERMGTAQECRAEGMDVEKERYRWIDAHFAEARTDIT